MTSTKQGNETSKKASTSKKAATSVARATRAGTAKAKQGKAGTATPNPAPSETPVPPAVLTPPEAEATTATAPTSTKSTSKSAGIQDSPTKKRSSSTKNKKKKEKKESSAQPSEAEDEDLRVINLTGEEEDDEEVDIEDFTGGEGTPKHTQSNTSTQEDEISLVSTDAQEGKQGVRESDDEDLSDFEPSGSNEAPGSSFVTHYWDGEMPLPNKDGKVGKLFSRSTVHEQFQQAEQLITFDTTTEPNITIGDFSTVFTPFLVAVPNSFRKVKVLFALQTTANQEAFDNTAVQGKVLALSGELIEDLTEPTVMIFPEDITLARTVKVPEGLEFSMKRRDPNLLTKAAWFSKDKVKRVGDIPPAVPVPACLVYDAFEKEIDAMVVYERLHTLPKEVTKAFNKTTALLRNFLKAQTVSVTKKSKQLLLEPEPFLSAPSIPALQWRQEVLKRWFPQPSQDNKNVKFSDLPTPANKTEETTAIVVQAVHAYEKMRQEQESKASGQQSTPFSTPDSLHINDNASSSNEKDSKATLGLPEFGFNRLMLQCGLVAGEESEIPEIWKKLAESGMTKADKKSVIKGILEEEIWFKEAKVQSYSQLVTMVMKRDFEEDTSMSSRKSAAKGLTIFAVPKMSDVEFDRLNEAAEALEDATHTTVKDITSVQLEAQSPKTYFQLVKLIKRFANLLYALFGTSCPLFIQLESLVGYLEEYGDTAIASMSTRTMASIAWIVHLQSRYFAKGYMKDPKPLRPEFTLMLSDVQTRRSVTYGDVPTSMYQSTMDKKDTNSSNGSNSGYNKRKGGNESDFDKRKKPKIVKLDFYHPLIKDKMQVFANRQKLPRVKALCEVCNINATDLFPTKPNLCIKSALFGTCFADCKRDHSKVSDDEAQVAMGLLEIAINSPNSVKVTK